MQSIDRAMHVIQVLVSQSSDSQLSITELSQKCGLPVSSMHRLLKAMSKHGLIRQDEQSKHYGLGNIWLEYGLRMYDRMDYISQIRPELERLMNKVDESVYLSQPIGMESLIIERIDSEKNPIRVYDQLGLRIPMNIGAANKAMLAYMSYQQAKEIIDALLPEPQRPEFWQTLKETRIRGCGISHSERTEGTTSVAAPILNHFGEVHGAVSIGFVSFNLSDDRLDFLIEHVMDTGKRMSAKLGYTGP
ncbi:IclR family transcriptional regulator [Bacillus badius]|uniref:Transcriptional regulator, IclR family n=1 Tax=Bacillus badius TaxID=1455 RepID=A0ABR5ARI5_BACBA|nr:IclR family transcriptional regulator [Bacillus badius]KIL72484.1 Transcriptional regulator, IclR family [Bacillus badius]KIL77377.1 Transcriptional regulator, IclR family [Bacillus badius]KZR57998.1 IclR family transcriptional regulator [Bacillus badius]MED4718597.1 IclR family transcriptional regulator [Bacillus badius]